MTATAVRPSTPTRPEAAPTLEWSGGWTVWVLCVVIAVVPQLLVTRGALEQGWTPVADEKVIAVSAVDAGHGTFPLLGPPSLVTENTTGIRPVHHLGPAETYVLAITSRLFGGTAGLLLGTLLVGIAATIAALLAGRALADAVGTLVVTAAVAGIVLSLGAPVFGSIWNPAVPVLPLLAALLAAAAYALEGWAPGLVVFVIAGSFSVQSHVTHVPVILAVVLPLVVVHILARRARWDVPAPPRGRGLLLGTGAAAVVMWLPTILHEVASTGPSNVLNLARALATPVDEATAGLDHATRVVATVAAVPVPIGPGAYSSPLWVEVGSSALSAVASLALLGALILAVVIGARRRDVVTTGLASSATCALLMGFYLLQRSTFRAGLAQYQTWWLWAVTGFVWTALLLAFLPPADSIVHRAAKRWSRRAPKDTEVRVARLAAGVAVVALAAVIAVRTAADNGSDRYPPSVRVLMDNAEETTDLIEANFTPSTPITLHLPDNRAAADDDLDVAARLIVDGYDVELASRDRDIALTFGSRHRGGAGRYADDVLDDDRVHLRITRRDLVGDGETVVVGASDLSRAQRRELAALRRRLTEEIDTGDLSWSAHGDVLFGGQDPDPESLLRGQVLESALEIGALHGDLPSLADARRYSDLSRREANEDRVVVELSRRAPA